MKLVNTNITANAISKIPNVPVVVPEKYRINTAIAIIILMILSAEPMFFFMILNFIY